MHNYTARIAWIILALGFVNGVVDAGLYRSSPFPASTVVFMVADAFLFFLWFRSDSDQRSYRRTPFLSLGVVGVAIIAIPYCLFRSRGFRNGVVGVFVFFSVLFGYALTSLIGSLIVRAVRS
jgi:hypothetical protein